MKAGAGWMTRENGKRLISKSYPSRRGRDFKGAIYFTLGPIFYLKRKSSLKS